MQAPSEQMNGPVLRAMLAGGTLAGEWALDRSRSSIRLKTQEPGLAGERRLPRGQRARQRVR